MNKISAVCTDIDGTLLDSNRQLSKRTIAAFARIPKDIPIILASSRMPSAMTHLQAELNILNQPLICFNGGYVIHYNKAEQTPSVLDTVMIPTSICQSIIGLTAGTSIHVSLYQNDKWYAPGIDQWATKEELVTKVAPIIKSPSSVINDWQITKTGAHKVMCMGLVSEIETLEKTLNEKFGNDLHAYRSKDTYIEIAPRAISKASALKMLLHTCFNLNMDGVMAFGDNYNDVEMIGQVGFGVAVENARDEVKAVAKEITLNNKADGVAITLEKYFG